MDVHIIVIVIQYVCLLFSLSVHEAGHAAMADYCGDPSARLMGRVTLNPVKHADPIGTVIMPLALMFFGAPFLFGWAKPVPFNPANLRDRARGAVYIALAGPGTNLLLALFFALVLRIIVLVSGIGSEAELYGTPLSVIPLYMVMINCVLMLFNLIPLPPLDGHHVLEYFLPPAGKRIMERIGPFGLLIAVLLAGRVIGTPLLLLMSFTEKYALNGFGAFFG